MKTIAVWSPGSAVGKSTVAIALAHELAQRGLRVAYFDVDVDHPSGKYLLGNREHPAGVAAIFRLALQGRLSESEFNRLSTYISGGKGQWQFIAGLSSRRRWAEAQIDALEIVKAELQEQFDYFVFDLASQLQQSCSAKPSPTFTAEVIASSDSVLAICGSEPSQIASFLDSWQELIDVASPPVRIIVNRLKSGVLGMKARQQILETLSKMVKSEVQLFIPDAPAEADRALASGVPINYLRKGKVRASISELATDLIAEHSQPQLAMAKLN